MQNFMQSLQFELLRENTLLVQSMYTNFQCYQVHDLDIDKTFINVNI